jgi:hypothetical protein
MTRAGELSGRVAAPASSSQASIGLDDLADEIDGQGHSMAQWIGIPT